MTSIKHYNLLILGSGPAGCTAAIYAARANLNFALITGMQEGGQITQTTKIANWPGSVEEISGVALMDAMMHQVHKFSSNIFSDNITKIDLTNRPFHLYGDTEVYSSDALIIATGATARYIGLTSEQKYLGRGVSTCAICDGFFYKGKKVVIVGGGNTAAEEALYLSKIVESVTLIHRRDRMRAETWLIKQLQNTANINFEFNQVVTEILGDEQGVTAVVTKDVGSGANKTIETHGVFVAIGLQPNTDIFAGQLDMENGYIKIGYGATTSTSVAGVFAAGDVTYGNHNQAIIAAGMGCSATLDAKNFLAR